MERVVTVTLALLLIVGLGGPASATAVGGDAATSVVDDAPRSTGGGTSTARAASSLESSLTVTSVKYAPEAPTVGEQTKFTVTVKNDGTEAVKVRSVSIIPKENYQYIGAYVEGTDYRKLAPGESQTIELYTSFDRPGVKTLQAKVEGKERVPGKRNNETVEDRRTFTVDVQKLQDPVIEFDAGNVKSQVTNRVRVTVTNPGETPLTDVSLQLGGDVAVTGIARQTAVEIAPGKSETFAFNVTTDSPGRKRIGASMKYTVVGDRSMSKSKRTTLSFTEPAQAEVDVSGVNVTRVTPRSTKVKITGDIVNVGQAAADGVQIGVRNANGAEPAPPQKSYPVGELEQNDILSFTLYAYLEPGTGTVPVTVSFTSNGISRTTKMDIGEAPALETTTEVSSDPIGPAALLFGSLVVVVVIGFMAYAWYNSGSGDEDPDSGSGEAPVSPDTGGSDTEALVQPNERGSEPQAQGPQQPGGQPQQPGYGRPQQGPQGQPQGRHAQGQPQGGHARGRPGYGRPQQGPRAPQGQRGYGQAQGRPGEPQGQAAGANGAQVRCDGCGRAYSRDQLGTIAIGDGETADTCQECQKEALTAAKDELGAQTDRELPEEGVDSLVEAMSGTPTCDGCGDVVEKDDLEAMTLPDGSSALACATCRESALSAARQELTGRGP